MNALEMYLKSAKLNERHAMNALQLVAGIISDNCVTAADVSSRDQAKAIAWLRDNKDKL